MSLLVGLTGNIGSGKTLSASIFKGLGAYILDADLICRKLVEPGQPALKEIIDTFSEPVIDEKGGLDRRKLAKVIFHDPQKKKILEKILHPKVFKFEKSEYKRICQENPQALVIIDAALLIESGNHKNMDKVVVVKTSKKQQIERLLARSDNLNLEEVLIRIKNQMPSKEKITYADYILENSLDETKLRNQVKDLYKKLILLAEENI